MRSRRELAVGLRDFVDNSANAAKEKAVATYEAKQLERQQMAELAQQRWQVQQARSAQFHPVKNIGQVAIDHDSRFFLVRNAASYVRPAPRKVSKARIRAAVMSMGLSEVVAAVNSSTKASDKIFSFDELVGYELLEDDSVVSAGTTATVASARSSLFGTRAYGASASAQVGMQKKVVEHLVLRIDTDDVEYPCVMITYISRPTVVSSNNYRFAFSQAQQTMSALGAILRQREREAPQAESATPVQQIVVNQTSAPNDMELLKQLKELLDAGIVTEEEFQAKKAQILGL